MRKAEMSRIRGAARHSVQYSGQKRTEGERKSRRAQKEGGGGRKGERSSNQRGLYETMPSDLSGRTSPGHWVDCCLSIVPGVLE